PPLRSQRLRPQLKLHIRPLLLLLLAPSLTAAILAGCGSEVAGVYRDSAEDDPTGVVSRPQLLTRISGDNQSAQVGEALPQPLVVEVRDALGRPLKGVPVGWQITEGGGSVSAREVPTDDQGRAAQSTWVLGPSVGLNTISASVTGLPAIQFSTLARPGPAVSLDLSPESMKVWVGGSGKLFAELTDAHGNHLRSGISWHSSSEEVVTVGPEGVLTGVSPGVATVTSRAEGITATADVEVIGDPPVAIRAVGDGDLEGYVGQRLPDPMVVAVSSAAGEPVGGVQVDWEVVDGEATLASSSSMTDLTGRARTELTLGHRPGRVVVSASLSGVGAVLIPAIAQPGPAQTVTINPPSTVLGITGQLQLQAVALDGFGNPLTPTFSWSSTNQEVATVSAEGVVTGMAGGEARVIVTAGAAADTADITVTSSSLDSLRIQVVGNAQEGTVGLGLEEPVSIRVTDSDGSPLSGRTVRWWTEPGSGQIVPAGGATGSDGSALATWTLGTRAGAQKAWVSVDGGPSIPLTASGAPGPLSSIQMDPPSASVVSGEEVPFTATGKDGYGNRIRGLTFSWASSDPTVAGVDQGGVASGLQPGTTRILASAGNLTTEAALTVTESNPEGNPGTVNDLSVVDVTDTKVTLRWTEVTDGRGLPAAYALRYGTTEISWGDAYPTEVSVPGRAIGSVLEYTWTGLEPETRYEFRLVAYRGTLNLSAVFGGLSNTVALVTDPGSTSSAAGTISVSPSSLSLTALGEEEVIEVQAFDASGNPVSGAGVSWTSLDPSIATVDQGGKVISRSVGVTTIVASALCCGTSDSVTVNVTQLPESVRVSPSSLGLPVGGTAGLSATVVDRNGYHISTGVFTWSSSKPSIASIDGSGRVTGIAPGSAQITAVSGSTSGKATLEVWSPRPQSEVWSHEPTEYQLLSDHKAEAIETGGWGGKGGGLSVAQEGAEPYSRPNSRRFHDRKGAGGPGETVYSGNTWFNFP
ncbi:MAG: Ig-like domain-containing protein, partial [Longimicrobiales bacterium]